MKNETLLQELRAMKDIGMKVSNRTMKAAATADLSEYAAMSYGEIADLFCTMYN